MDSLTDGLIVNRVAEGAIETLDLAAMAGPEPAAFDLEPHLYKGLVLREREFRQSLKELDWSAFEGKDVAVFCSVDALVPTWAFMLIAARLEGVATSVSAGTPADVRQRLLVSALEGADWEAYRDKPVVVKGCGNDLVPLDAFVQATHHLQGVASKVMYGEPCSSVPVWRRKVAPASRPTGSAPARVSKPAGPPR